MGRGRRGADRALGDDARRAPRRRCAAARRGSASTTPRSAPGSRTADVSSTAAGELGRRRDDDVGARVEELLAAADPPRHADRPQAVRAGGDHVERAVADHRSARSPRARASALPTVFGLALAVRSSSGPATTAKNAPQAEGVEQRLGERARLGRRDAEAAAAHPRAPATASAMPGERVGVRERGDRVALAVARDARDDEVRVGRRADDLGERERQRRPDVAGEVGRVARGRPCAASACVDAARDRARESASTPSRSKRTTASAAGGTPTG